MLEVACAGAAPQPAELLRLKDVTVELVDLLVDELRSHCDIWSPRKKAAQDDYARRKTWLAEHGMEVEGV